MLQSILNDLNNRDSNHAAARWLAAKLALIALTLFIVTGCQTQKQPSNSAIAAAALNAANATNSTNTNALVLREGDTIRISFPGAAANLSGTHTIARDGNVTLELVGEIKAAGKTIDDLKVDLLKAYSSQIETKIVTVELISSSFPIYVSGAVLSPGKVMADHPMTVLEAIMERSGPDYTKADLKHVEVLRQEDGALKNYNVNLKDVLDGKSTEQFYLRPNDIIYIRERFNWF